MIIFNYHYDETIAIGIHVWGVVDCMARDTIFGQASFLQRGKRKWRWNPFPPVAMPLAYTGCEIIFLIPYYDVKLNGASDVGIKKFVIIGNYAARRTPVPQERACLGLVLHVPVMYRYMFYYYYVTVLHLSGFSFGIILYFVIGT